MSKPKRYRLKRNEFEVVGTRFESLEAGPVVVLQPADFDVKEVGLAEFKADYEEVPVEEEDQAWVPDGEVSTLQMVRAARLVARGLEGRDRLSMVTFLVDGCPTGLGSSVRELRAILDAARKSLGGEGEPAERCRVGEWMPGRYINFTNMATCRVLCNADRGGDEGLTVLIVDQVTAWVEKYCDTSEWDAARARWIDDGRPTS